MLTILERSNPEREDTYEIYYETCYLVDEKLVKEDTLYLSCQEPYWYIPGLYKWETGVEYSYHPEYGYPELKNTAKQIEIGPGCVAIGRGVFAGFRELVSVRLPSSLKEIDREAFAYCKKLQEVIFYDAPSFDGTENTTKSSNTLWIRGGIKAAAFKDCESLHTFLTPPDSMRVIGDEAFENCKKLSKFSFPKYLEYIGRNAFCGCKNFPSPLVFPDSVSVIGAGAFLECGDMQSITMPASIRELDGGTFEEYSSLIFTNGPKEIGGWNAFVDCLNMTSLVIPPSVTTIKNNRTPQSFYGALQDFVYCFELLSITISTNLVEIPAGTFENAYQLKNIVITPGINERGEVSPLTAIVQEVIQYSEADMMVRICDGVETIDRGAFAGCKNVKTVMIPNTVTSIAADAFCDVAHIIYDGSAGDDGTHWGALSIN